MNVLKFILICFKLVECDLIGFNRLGNNLASHDRFRIGPALQRNPGFNYAYLTNMSPSEKLRFMQLQVLQNQKRAARPKNARRQNRRKLFLKHYNVK